MSIKQDRAIKLITSKQSDNVGQAMRQAGYTESTSKTPSRLTNSKAWKKKLGALAEANNVTIEQYMMNLGLGMTAMKQNNYTGEITIDVGMRLTANKQAERFIFKDSGNDKQGISQEDLQKLADESDEVKLTELLFKKT